MCPAVQQLAVVHVRVHSWQERRELKAGANAGILLKVVLVRMVFRTVHQLEPSIGEVRVELSMVGGVLLDDRAVDFVRNQGDVRSQAHGPSKLAALVPGVPLVSAVPWHRLALVVDARQSLSRLFPMLSERATT